ncbi:MAG: phospho-N-acetylmuramoyl-pentapeptide-transferase [Actinomycetota bacterium]|nr:phospho-N-acetylmuramoyl-pentapeptide-transferase [Actinomycetota bacterium]
MRFPTYQIFLTAVLALVVIAALAPFWIRLLKSRGIGQNVRVDGPQGHLLKEGTPTMGGVMILTTVIVTFLLMGRLDKLTVIVMIAMVGCGLLGLLDDVSKVLRERSLGLAARYKLLLLGAISVTVGLLAVNYSGLSTDVAIPLTKLSLPMGKFAWHLKVAGSAVVVPWIYLLFLYILVAGTANTVNLTDGLDGLAAGTVTIVMLAYAGIAFRQGHLDLALFAAAIGGTCIGFLWYNSYPADIFMGDTGAIGLGGAVAAMAVVTKTELLLVVIGGIYVIEGLSVIIQILVFRLTKKRAFKMAPIHHHFEMLGWSETKVMIRFWIITGVLAGAGFALYFISAK